MESFVGLSVTRCRGADSRARRKAADQHRPALKWKWPKVCHCEGALRPWQSREGSAVSYRLPLKWHAPIASVAALSERHAGWHYLRHKFIGARPPKFVIPRSEATWESPATAREFAEACLLSDIVLRDCHVGLRPPRNDKSGGLEPPNRCCNTCGC